MSRIPSIAPILVAVFAIIATSLPATAFEAPDLFQRAETYRQELIAQAEPRRDSLPSVRTLADPSIR